MYLQASFDAARVGRDGLPVKRVNHSRRSPVVADSEELDAWILHRIQLPPGASRERTALSVSIRQSANAIKTGISASWSVGDLSQSCHLTWGQFRLALYPCTGISPKALPHCRALNPLSIQRRVKGVLGKKRERASPWVPTDTTKKERKSCNFN